MAESAFNEGSVDVDFRVESNDNTHMLFVDGGNNRVGIGTNSPGLQFVVNAADAKSDNAYVAYIGNQEATDDRSYGLQIVAGSTVNDAPLFIQDHDGSNDLLIVRGNGRVGIGGTAPTELLEIFASSTPAIQLTQTGGTSYNGGIKLAGNDLEIRGSSGIMEFYNGGNNDGDSATLRMAITAAGNVGIATGTTVNNLFQVQCGTDHRLGIWGSSSYSAIQSVNDANTAQQPLRFDATTYTFYGSSTTWNHSPEISASDSSTSATFGLKITNSSSTSDTIAGIIFKNYDSNAAWVRSIRTGSAEGVLLFGTNSGGGIAESNITEKMRIKADGALTLVEKANAIANSLRFQGLETVGDDEAQNYTMDGTCCIVILANHSSDDAALFFMSYASATITKIADPSNEYDTSATDGKSCIYKSSNSATFTIENKRGGPRNMGVAQIAVTSTV